MPQTRFNRIRAVAQKHVDAGALSGIEWAVLRSGKDWARGAYGYNDGIAKTPMPDKPIYRIYSMTKPIVSAVAMMLIEQGKLALFHPLAAYLPDFTDMKVLNPDGSHNPAAPITIEHLFTHRAGFSYTFLMDCPIGRLYRKGKLRNGGTSLADFAAKIATYPLAHQPGSTWHYSVATDVLARVIEVVLDRPLQDILDDLVFTPLGLKDTGFMIKSGQEHRLMAMFGRGNIDEAIPPDPAPQTLIPANIAKDHPYDDPSYARGGMGLFSTIDDYLEIAKFLRTGQNPSGARLLSRKSVEMLWTDRLPDSQKPFAIGPFEFGGYGWGLGGRVMVNTGAAMIPTNTGECGWAGAASTFFWIDPVDDIIGVVMTQYLGSQIPIGEEIMTAVYQAIDP